MFNLTNIKNFDILKTHINNEVIILFGYLRIFKPHLRICEYDTYKSIYCALCKELGKSYGLVSRFTLSYDFTFLALLELAVNDKGITFKKERCIAHPLKKTPCANCSGGISFTASAAIMTVYHKLKDDKADKGLKRKIIASLLLLFYKKPYKKASLMHPELSKAIETEMKNQSTLEKEQCKSLDKAGEPTANIMKAIAGGISEDKNKKRLLERMGYLLGRYVYFCDAIEDLQDDYKSKNYNALLLQNEITELNEAEKKKLIEITEDTVYLTLGELANTYVLLSIEKYKPILDNIIYLGLNNTFSQIIKGEFEKEKKK